MLLFGCYYNTFSLKNKYHCAALRSGPECGMIKKRKRQESAMPKVRNLKQKMLYLSVFAIAIFFMWLLKLPCVYLYFLHIPCPGCGMTRACLRALQLDFSGAFSYHPMFWSIPVLLLLYFLDGKLFKKRGWNAALLVFIGIGFLANWIRMLFFG